MKRKLTKLLWLPICLCALGGCSELNGNAPKEFFTDHNATITWSGKDDSSINSVKADVKVYTMNSRKNSSPELSSSYRLSTKIIGGEQYTRFDYNDSDFDGVFRSVISSPSEVAVFDQNSSCIEYRIPIPKESFDLAFFQEGTGFGKVNLDAVRQKSERLAFDVNEDSKSKSLVIALPSSYFDSDYSTRISTKVSFDTETSTLSSMEIVDENKDGSTVTTTITNVYEEYEGEFVKVGSITTIDTAYKEAILDVDVEYFESIDDIPIVSESDFKKMQEAGSIFENDSIKFGNPADMSSVETVIEVYENIEINSTDDEAFRILF